MLYRIIKRQAEIINKEIDKKGYIKSMKPQDNLLKTVDNWTDIERDLGGGQGGELKKDKYGRKKFCALHSSAALCVNNFALFKKHKDRLSFGKYKNFDKAAFEQRLSTKLKGTPPNLDFYLENSNVTIGIESKFTEHFEKRIEHTKENLCKYFMREELDYLPRLFDGLILHYMNCTNKMYLNVAQLIKHSIALLNNKRNKKAVLVYIYWQPENWIETDIFKQHRKEIDDFANKIGKFIEFKHLSYCDLWQEYENCELLKDHVQLVRNRYSLVTI